MSDLALQLIAENRRSRDTFLDLGKCGLTEVPAEVGELVWLESLSLADEWYEWGGPKWQRRTSQNAGETNSGLSDIAPLANLTSLRTLFIADTQVSDLAPLVGVSALQSLNVSGTNVFDLRPLASLSALQSLSVFSTKISDLAPLVRLSALQSLNVSGTQVSDLAPLARLSALQSLDVSVTNVSDFAPLVRLSALQSLEASHTKVSDLAPLARLSVLQSLDLCNTQVSDLAPIAHLSALQSLEVSGAQVSDLTALARLSALQLLDISNTKVSDLAPLAGLISRGCPVQWSDESWKGPGIYVKDCPLTNPPPEIASQGNAAILNYFEERRRGGVDHLYEAKMLILGEGGAGKTSLLRRLYQRDQPLPSEKETTKGITIHRHEFELNNGRRFR